MPLRVTSVVVALVLGSAPAAGQVDLIKLASGSPIRARVWDAAADPVTFNVYGTSIRSVTFGTERLPAKSIKQIVPDPDPYRAFWHRADALLTGTAAEWCELAAEAEKNKLRGLARVAYTEALVRDRHHAAALKALDAKAKEIVAADPRLNDALRAKLDAYLGIEDFRERQAAHAAIRELGCPWPFHYVERAWRSAREKKGRTDDRILTLRSRQHKGVYTIYVPEAYDPFTPTPLVVGLHGGGRGGKDGKAVIGTGTSAMNFYQSGASRLGWLVVCPNAIRAPWNQPLNDGFLHAVIDEVCMAFNVDKNRIYLTGHSMGGFGAWHFGPLYAHRWAAVAPMAGGGSPNLKRLDETRCGVYLYHGANDEVVSAANDRELAVQMKKSGMDFVYAEIPDSGHGFPPEVEQEMWEFFKVRRRAVAADRGTRGPFTTSEEPESSFLDKPGRDETVAFGPIGKPPSEESGSGALNALIADLESGGGHARRAAEELGAIKTDAAAARVAAVLAKPDAAADSRRFAAEALGNIGLPAGAKALHKALADPELAVVGAAAAALGRIPSPETPKAYLRCVRDLAARFEKKLTGRKMEFPDFESHLAAVTSLVEGASALKDPASAPVVNLAATTFLLPEIDVDRSERAGLDPAVPRRKLARAVLAACEVMRDPSSKPVLTALRDRADLGVSDEARALLSGL